MIPWIAAAVVAGVVLHRRPSIKVPVKAKKLLPYFQKWSRRSGIPIDVLLAWAKNESDYRPREYNPERGVMQSWACAVADDDRWRANPAYAKAVAVCARLRQGEDPESISSEDWTFGSCGLFQVSRMAATDAGCMAHQEANTRLFELDRNFSCAIAVILRKATSLGLTRRPSSFTDADWARIRAAYVMGAAGAARAPAKAAQIGEKLLVALREVRSGLT